MTSLNISLPEPLKAYVETKVATGDYGTPSEYVRELIRLDKQGLLRRLELELLDAVSSTDIELDRSELDRGGLVKTLRQRLTGKQTRR